MADNRDNKFLGAMIGCALGDAIGEMATQYESRAELLKAVSEADLLYYTDDTAMSLAMAESLLEKAEVDSQHLGDTFRRYYHNEPRRGYGLGPPKVFHSVEHGGITYKEAARLLYDGQGSYGNGAAMRVTPLALYYCDAGDLYHKAELSAEVTHSNSIGIDGAAVMARAVSESAKMNPRRPFSPQSYLKKLESFARTAEIRSPLKLLKTLLDDRIRTRHAVAKLGHDVIVQESLPYALYCFLRNPHSFIECLLAAILYGGDSDTIGAMAGALSGAYLGVEAIPVRWCRKLENRQLIENYARELAARTLHDESIALP
ncbi:MAG: ADP-ribosylglycohydrolase family protein [Gammaproteobacteria bacterium]